jgi:hypothetical protein
MPQSGLSMVIEHKHRRHGHQHGGAGEICHAPFDPECYSSRIQASVATITTPQGDPDMTDETNSPAEAMFDKALDLAEKHLQAAMREGGPLSSYVAVAMIEAAVNQAVEETSHEDVVDMLRDLATQIEQDAEEQE